MENRNHSVLWSTPLLLQSDLWQHRRLHTVTPMMMSVGYDAHDFPGILSQTCCFCSNHPGLPDGMEGPAPHAVDHLLHPTYCSSCSESPIHTRRHSTSFHRNFLAAPLPKMTGIFFFFWSHCKWLLLLKILTTCIHFVYFSQKAGKGESIGNIRITKASAWLLNSSVRRG